LNAYLDASAILPTLIDEPGSPAVDAFIAAAKAPLVVSGLVSTGADPHH
jgi:hypothetical protein